MDHRQEPVFLRVIAGVAALATPIIVWELVVLIWDSEPILTLLCVYLVIRFGIEAAFTALTGVRS